MRVWEFEDNRAVPFDLVREQDFILRVRRMQRTGAPTLVLNFAINALDQLAKNRVAFDAVVQKLQEFAQMAKGVYSEMSNGDVFIEWPETSNAEKIATQIVEAIFPSHVDSKAKFLNVYHLPADYAALRERANYYVEVVRAAAAAGVHEGGNVGTAQGQLTAKSLDQIETMLNEIDLRPYGRMQKMYRVSGDTWHVNGEEYFVSFEDLRRERFPKLEIVASEHFFFALCGMVDQRLLQMLTRQPDIIANRAINLNLSVSSVVGRVFAKFVHSIPAARRSSIGFELHRGDLFQDLSRTLDAIDLLKKEGFRVALDSITPDMARYVDLAAFPVDAIKINVSKDRVLQLADAQVRAGLAALPPERLIFFRCDNERALAAGRDMGVTAFQGWLIDDLAEKKAGA